MTFAIIVISLAVCFWFIGFVKAKYTLPAWLAIEVIDTVLGFNGNRGNFIARTVLSLILAIIYGIALGRRWNLNQTLFRIWLKWFKTR